MKNDGENRTRVRLTPELGCEISLGAKEGPQVSHVPPKPHSKEKATWSVIKVRIAASCPASILKAAHWI